MKNIITTLLVLLGIGARSQNTTVISPVVDKGVVIEEKVYLQKPRQSTPTIVTAIKGEVKLVPWDRPDEIDATIGAELVQGDALKTSEAQAVKVEINGVGKVVLGENAELIFGSLLPEKIVMRQNEGAAEYESLKKMSIRVNASLLEIEAGKVQTKVENNVARIDVKEGVVKLVYIDVSGKTRVWEVGAGKWISIDDNKRRVRTTGILVGSD